MTDFIALLSENGAPRLATIRSDGSQAPGRRVVMKQWSCGIVFALVLIAAAPRGTVVVQPRGPYARIAIMRAIDGHAVEWEAGYVRHLDWHRQAKDPFNWYSYSVWASNRRQRWIVYATFGHTAEELSNPISPAEDERDNLINVLPH